MTSAGASPDESSATPAEAPTESGAFPCITTVAAMADSQLACFHDGLTFADIPQQDAEFIAAEPPHHIRLPHHALQARRHRLQHPVAGGMAVAVIHRLETVEVKVDQRRRGSITPHIGKRTVQLAFEATPIEDVEQRIDIRLRLEFGHLRAGGGKFRLQPVNLSGKLRGRFGVGPGQLDLAFRHARAPSGIAARIAERLRLATAKAARRLARAGYRCRGQAA